MKLDEENAGLSDALLNDKMEDENAEQSNQIPTVYS